MRKFSSVSNITVTTETDQQSITDISQNFCQIEEKNIIIICTDMTLKSSKHVIYTALALAKYDFTVTIITCRYNKNLYPNLRKIKIIQLASFIPQSFLGYLKKLCFTLRSAYLGLWILFKNPVRHPLMIFCESHPIILPILNFSNYRLSYFHYQYDTTLKKSPTKNPLLTKNFLTKKCLPFANFILVPNTQYRWLYKKSFNTLKINPVVMYPHLSTNYIEKQQLCSIHSYFPFFEPNDCIFLVLGHYNEKSNFELAIRAFEHLTYFTENGGKKKRYLIVYGHYSRKLAEEKIYFKKLKQIVSNSKSSDQFILLEYKALSEKLSLIYGCTVLLHTTTDEHYNKHILEAMFMKKAIIATKSGFSKEAIKDGVTGYLTEASYVHFAVAMNKFLTLPNIADIMGNMAHIEFLRRYSFESFGERLTRLIYQLGGNWKNKSMEDRELELDDKKEFFR